MEKIILRTKNEKDAQIIISLANRLGAEVVQKTTAEKVRKNRSIKALSYLKKISRRGKVSQLIKDPVKWQRMVRKDRKLIYR